MKRGRGKPFFMRWWFYVPVLLMVVGALVAWVGWIYLTTEYERRAAEFDLAQMEKMEAASVIFDREGRERVSCQHSQGAHPRHLPAGQKNLDRKRGIACRRNRPLAPTPLQCAHLRCAGHSGEQR